MDFVNYLAINCNYYIFYKIVICRLLSQKQFTQSTVVRDQVETYRKESDSVAMFIEEEGYKPAINGFISFKSLYSEYKSYCIDNGYRACSTKTVSERLRMLNIESKRTNQALIVFLEK